MELITHDRGLGSAYERFYFYELLAKWARAHDVTSVLEGPIDGMAGVPGVHAVGLARAGCEVRSVVTSAAQAEVTRGIYARAAKGANAQVSVLEDASRAGELQPADLVVVYHAFEHVPDWRAYLSTCAKLANKLLVVTVCNPDNWGVSILRAVGRARGIRGLEPPEAWQTSVLAPELWRHGRVKEHTYFDCPWWPDLQVSPGQSLLDRAKKLVRTARGGLTFTATSAGSELAQKFVYGPEDWPYFRGDSFERELGPALARHPNFEHARPSLQARAGHLHAFAVDMRPGSPQARRKLRIAAGGA